jgi:hypothetical protein
MKTGLSCKFGPDQIHQILGTLLDGVNDRDDGGAGRESTHFWCEDGQEIVFVCRATE